MLDQLVGVFFKKAKLINIYCLFAALIHFLITTYTDSIIFKDANYIYSRKYWIIKVCILFLLFFFWQFAPIFIFKIRNGIKSEVLFCKHFLIYFCIMIFFLLLTWPGVWRWDDLHVLNSARHLNFLYWQHWLTSLYFIFCLAVIPFPGGILIFQSLIISLILAFISAKLNDMFEMKFKFAFYVPMLFPAAIDNNLFPMRSSICAYLELFLMFLILFKYYDKTDISIREVFLFSSLLALVSAWRQEAGIYLLFLPIVLFVAFNKRLSNLNITVFVLVVAILSGSIMVVQTKNKGETEKYNLTAMLSPLSAILKTNFKSDSPEDDLLVIDKIISVNSLIQSDGIAVFWSEGVKSYTAEDLEAFHKVCAKLLINNLPAFIKNQIAWFLKASGFAWESPNSSGSSPNLFIQDSQPIHFIFRDEFLFNHPISYQLRARVIELLECRQYANYEKKTFLYGLFYNAVPPILILLVICACSLFKRKWILVAVSSAILAKASIIFATAPAYFFMYYFPVYICGYGLGVFALLIALQKGVKKIPTKREKP